MSLYTVTSNPAFADVVNAALKTEARVLVSAGDAIAALLGAAKPKARFVILDLETIADAGRLVDFIKSSPPVRDTLVVAIGTERDFSLLDQRTCEALSGVLYSPFTAAELALVVTGLAIDLNPDAQIKPSI
jgi:hypothetical protein